MHVENRLIIRGKYSQQVALQTQRHWRLGILNRVTRFVDIDVEYLLACDSPERGLGSERGHQPKLDQTRRRGEN